MHMRNVDKKASDMSLLQRRPDGGRDRPAVNASRSSNLLTMRLTVASLFALFLAFAWAGFGFNQEAARAPAAAATQFPDLYEASIAELQDGLQKGLFTSVDLVKVGTVRPPWIRHSIDWGIGVLREDRGSQSPRSHSPRGH